MRKPFVFIAGLALLALAACGNAWRGTSSPNSSQWTWMCDDGRIAPDAGCPDAGSGAPQDDDDSAEVGADGGT